MTRKEVLEIIAEVANEANEYMPCWHIQKATRDLLLMEDPDEVPQDRIAELEKDKARLDWLEKYPEAGEPYIVYHPPSDHITWKVKGGKEYDSLRESIDAAMKENNGTNTGK